MSARFTYKIFIAALLLIAAANIQAQSKRSLINEGVDLYKEKKFADAEVNFKKGLEKDAASFEGNFNLGDAYYKQGRYDEALQAYKNALSLTDDKYMKARAYHNIGNSLLKSQKLKESIEAYKNSLKLNPEDLETKYNLSYALRQQQQNKNDKNKDDKNKDQNKDNQQQNQDKNKDQNKDQNKQDQQNKNDQNKDQQNQQQQQQQQKDQISKAEAQRILDALKNNESDLQKKLRKAKAKPVVTEKKW